MWIFAYGSLIFRPSFAHLETRRAFVSGWARRLWQGSPDHRGVPDAPGLVATLVRAPEETCGGLAYRVDSAAKNDILAELDVREQAGFVRAMVSVADSPGGASFAEALTYVAAPENAHFMGPLEAPAIAAWVASRRGPSGPNREYVERAPCAAGPRDRRPSRRRRRARSRYTCVSEKLLTYELSKLGIVRGK